MKAGLGEEEYENSNRRAGTGKMGRRRNWRVRVVAKEFERRGWRKGV